MSPRARRGRRSVGWRFALAFLLATISLGSVASGVSAVLNVDTFDLVTANATLLNCFRQSAAVTPTAHVVVTRGTVNDTLEITLNGFKPNIAFDLFTVQNSNKLANGSPDPAFVNFGLAWYQSDIQADSGGHADVIVQTILLDQIFGFDPVVNLAPTNTFHVGFWFNDPADAAPCGFDVTKPTPFNGDHNAGPLAMISLPNATTGKGPLFTTGLTANGSAPASGGGSTAAINSVQFDLSPNGGFLSCFRQSAGVTPTAHVTVTRGNVNDTLEIVLNGFKPNIAFDLFTVQNSSKLADGSADPAFKNFGLAWYQSDIQADSGGHADVTIKTILLDQIFGFDPAVNLAPTNTFHVGFWFNDPADAAPCGFDVTKPTPFNGEHTAGPLAMISLPNATTSLGPLSTTPAPNGLEFFPLSAPVRLLDTRGLHAFKNVPTLTANQTVNLPGHFTFDSVTVPAAAVALVGNATVDNSGNPAAPPGFATVFPSGQSLPGTSTLNFVPGTVRPNEITVGLGADGTFNLFSSTGGNFIIDITGYYAPPATGGLFFHTLSAPVRLLDTRGQPAFKNVPTLTANQTVSLPASFTFKGITVPGGALALVGNATVDNSTNPVPAGFATLFPGGQNLPATSTLNFVPGTVAPNAFTVGVGGGNINLFSSTGGNFIIDIVGYYDANATGGLEFTPLSSPVRELDTRGQPAFKNSPTLTAGQTLNVPGSLTFNGVTIPAGAKALLGNATVDNSTNPVPAGFATLFPGGTTAPLASNLNFVPGTVAPNAFVVAVGTDGTYNLFSSSGGNFILDISGFFSAGPDTNAVKASGATTPSGSAPQAPAPANAPAASSTATTPATKPSPAPPSR